MAYYKKKSKARTLIPISVILALIAIGGFSFSVYMSRSTRNVIDLDTMKLVQLENPKDGDKIAIIHTTLGDISAVLYPEYAPKTVDNFISLAKSGYYNDTYVYNIVDKTYFTAGSPTKTGALDESKNSGDEEIPLEYSQNLWPFKGAIYSVTTKVDKGFIKAFMNTATRYGGSRFGICGSIDMTDKIKSEMEKSTSKKDLTDAFLKLGGIPNFSQQMTIFAQVYDGMDVVDKINNSQVEDETDYNGYIEPKEEIKIKSIDIKEFGGK